MAGRLRCASLLRIRDEEGLTTAGMVISLLVVLSLIFSAAQIYRVNSLSSRVQNVADAAALAAENEVAHFMTVVKVCDAVTLSLSLTSLATTGVGVVALCVPPAMPVGERLIEIGEKISRARNSFAQKASQGLNRFQKLLPALAAMKGYQVAVANNEGNSRYVAMALLCPLEGDDISIEEASCIEEFQEDVDKEAPEIKAEAAEAEEAAVEANEAKTRGFFRDCGDNPAYCMYERAASLAGMAGAANPLYQSEDTWSFSVALKRAQKYYHERLLREAPTSSSVEEQASSALRKRFYRFAEQELLQGYVHESEEQFQAYFPLLPRNTSEMKTTFLYTSEQFPCTRSSEGSLTAHAWEGCPNITESVTYATLSDVDTPGYSPCSKCKLSASEMGKVGAASTSINNGFEYHYVAVAQAAQEYQKAREKLDPLSNKVKERVSGILEELKEALGEVVGQRIEARPPGHNGVIVLVADCGQESPAGTFSSSFVSSSGTLGTRAALSAATLLADPADDEGSVISSLLDSFKQNNSGGVGAAGIALDCWSWLLQVYTKGQEALLGGIEQMLNSIPLMSASGLGSWARDFLEEGIETIALEPANLDALKPVVVNTAHVAQKDGNSVGARLLSIKQQVISHPLSSNDLFASIIGSVEAEVVGWVNAPDAKITVAEIEVIGEGGPAIPLEIALPPVVRDTGVLLVQQAADTLRSLASSVVGVRSWE